MSQQEVEDCTRFCTDYRDMKLYIIVGCKRIDIGIENSDQFLTVAAMDMVCSFANWMLDNGADIEDIAGRCFESSRRRGDLPWCLSEAIIAEQVR
jgi:hypothetical protein